MINHENISKVRKPVQNRSINKKNEIIKTAYILFNKKSYHDISIRIIARKAGVSIGTIYSYFKDKQEIFIEVSKMYGEGLYNSLFIAIENEIIETDTIEDSIYKIILKLKEIISSNYNLHKESILLSMTDASIQEYYTAQEKTMANKIGMIFLNKFKDKISIKNEPAIIFIVTKTIEGIVEYLLFYNVKIKEENIFREMSTMIANYLECKK